MLTQAMSMLAAVDAGKIIPGTDISTTQTSLGVGTASYLGAITMLLGLVVVFFGLVFLIVIISAQTSLFRGLSGGKKADAKPEVKEDAPIIAPPVAEAEVPVAASAAEVEDQDEIAAVIAAVMAMLEQTQKRPEGFVVRSIRRVGTQAPAWNAAARRENLFTR